MFCKNCGNEIKDDSNFCDKCGKSINDNSNNTNAKKPLNLAKKVVNTEEKNEENKNNGQEVLEPKKVLGGCLIIILIPLLFGALPSLLNINKNSQNKVGSINEIESNIGDEETKNIDEEAKKVEIVFDAKQFYKEDGTTITEEDIINIYGEPQNIEEWNYEKADGRSYPIKTYSYGHYEYEYHFNNNHLQRISIYQDIEYTSKDDILSMFNLEKTFNSSITDTGVAYRVSNCGIHDLWIWSMTDKVLNGVYISYSGIFSD